MPRERVPVGSEATGAVRVAHSEMRADYDRLVSSLRAVPSSVIVGYAMKGRVGRDRARNRLDGLVPASPFIATDRALIYRVLYTRTDPLVSKSSRNGVEVMGLALGNLRGVPDVEAVSLGLWVSDHALCRLYARSPVKPDFRAVILEAHDNLCRASSKIFETVAEAPEREWAIPCHGGMFLAKLRVVACQDGFADTLVIFSADTWIETQQAHSHQIAQIDAVRYPAHDAPRLIDGFMIPPVLRPAAKAVGGIVSLPIDAMENRKTRPRVAITK